MSYNACQYEHINYFNPEYVDLILKLYLDCLGKTRCHKYDSWLKIGAIIFNEGGSFELLNVWSRQSNKYNYSDCAKLWKSFRSEKYMQLLTLATLKKYAFDDNPMLYKNIKNKIRNLPISSKIIKDEPNKLPNLKIVI